MKKRQNLENKVGLLPVCLFFLVVTLILDSGLTLCTKKNENTKQKKCSRKLDVVPQCFCLKLEEEEQLPKIPVKVY